MTLLDELEADLAAAKDNLGKMVQQIEQVSADAQATNGVVQYLQDKIARLKAVAATPDRQQ